MSREEKIKSIAIHYGYAKQSIKAIEECNELSVALAKAFNSEVTKETFYAIAEEIADVRIMIAQLEYLLDAEEDVERIIEMKLNRQLERIKEETK